MRGAYAQEAEQKTLYAQDPEADGEIVGPAGPSDRAGDTGSRLEPLAPHSESEDQDEDGKAGPEDGMQLSRPTAQ